MFAIMTNWKTEFHKPLTRPGVKHDEEMSICSSTPQAHRGYINSSLLESDLKMAVFILETRYPSGRASANIL